MFKNKTSKIKFNYSEKAINLFYSPELIYNRTSENYLIKTVLFKEICTK